MRHKESQQLARWYTKGALSGIKLDIYLSLVGECFLQVFNEGMTLTGLDDDVIYVSFRIPSHLSHQGLTHEPLEGRSCVLQAEGHTDVAIHPARCDEGCFFFVLLCHLDLMIAGEGIQEAKEVTAGGGVNDLIYPRE
jgi:hypothetical protein